MNPEYLIETKESVVEIKKSFKTVNFERIAPQRVAIFGRSEQVLPHQRTLHDGVNWRLNTQKLGH